MCILVNIHNNCPHSEMKITTIKSVQTPQNQIKLNITSPVSFIIPAGYNPCLIMYEHTISTWTQKQSTIFTCTHSVPRTSTYKTPLTWYLQTTQTLSLQLNLQVTFNGVCDEKNDSYLLTHISYCVSLVFHHMRW